MLDSEDMATNPQGADQGPNLHSGSTPEQGWLSGELVGGRGHRCSPTLSSTQQWQKGSSKMGNG